MFHKRDTIYRHRTSDVKTVPRITKIIEYSDLACSTQNVVGGSLKFSLVFIEYDALGFIKFVRPWTDFHILKI